MGEDKRKKKKRTPRQVMPEQLPRERAKNFESVTSGYTEEQAMLEASRCLQCKKPACMLGCPVNIDIPEFIRKIKKGKFLRAAKEIKKYSLLPAVCGRVCPQESQCEGCCLLGKRGAPVAIGNLERFAADYEAEHGDMELPKMPQKTGRRIAIVGSGPAGLAAAGDLIKMGHDVTIFEALHKPGGVLIYGIPEFRLPKAIVKREIDYLQRLGVQIKCDYVIGKIKTIDQLLEEGFNVVFICTGAGLPIFMDLPGENLNGVYSANEFLTRTNLMRAYEFPSYDTPIKRLKRVAVIGGGNVAMDAVRTAVRLGAEKAYVIYRRTKKEMPARVEEIEHAEQEGVEFNFLTSPIKIIGNEKGWVRGIQCIRMELGEPDISGRRRPMPVKDSEFVIEADEVIISIGASANPIISQSTPDLKLNRRGYIEVYGEQGCYTSKKGVFAGGDIVTGSATVILAMGAGRLAARLIDNYMKTGYWPEL